jgi:NAD+ synthase (glutamine-hydrolysing)
VNANLVGGQDELVFDGASTAYDPRGNLILRMKSFEEDFEVFDVDADAVFRERLKDIRRRELKDREDCPFTLRQVDNPAANRDKPKETMRPAAKEKPSGVESIYKALVLGTRDYVNKNGFKNVVIAISAGQSIRRSSPPSRSTPSARNA